jgi:hypothetical protein
LDAVLACPWKKLFHTARVVGDYIPTDQNSQMLPIIKGQHIVIVSREGDSTGWWKGRYGGDVSAFDHCFQQIIFKISHLLVVGRIFPEGLRRRGSLLPELILIGRHGTCVFPDKCFYNI